MDAGVMQVRLEPVSLAAVADTVLTQLSGTAAAAGVTLSGVIPPRLQVQGSRDRMEQVLYNLVDNALRHTPAGGRVSITAQPDAGRVRLTVADTGTGIPAEHLPFLFDRFYKVDPARTPSQGGTGLGLAVVKQLVELQGGSVEAASELGRGAVFTVTLPGA